MHISSQTQCSYTYDPPTDNTDWGRVDIADTTDPDFEWHGKHGTVVDVFKDGLAEITGGDRDSRLYCVELEDQEQTLEFRH